MWPSVVYLIHYCQVLYAHPPPQGWAATILHIHSHRDEYFIAPTSLTAPNTPRVGVLVHVPFRSGENAYSICPGVDCWDIEYPHTYLSSCGIVNGLL